MATNILNNCHFDLTKVKKLYIGTSLSTGGTINFPLDYITVPNSSDSVIQYSNWTTSDIVTIGSQNIQFHEVLWIGENIIFTEELLIDQRGRNYVKTLSFELPGLDQDLIDDLELYTLTDDGYLIPTPTVGILLDENDQYLIIGYDFPLNLDNIADNINEENNNVTITYKSQSISRSRDIIFSNMIPIPSPSITPTISLSTTPSISITKTPTMTPSLSISTTPSLSIPVTPSLSVSETPSLSISVTPSLSISETPSLSISITPSLSLSPSITPSITPSTSMIIYYKCADNGFHFNGYSDSLLGLLTVGVVHITTGTLTDYVIEWHLNSTSGSTVFITGNSGNTDPSIQAFHPLVSELVQAGTLYPVIRYANVNGVNYSAYSNLGYLYSPDLLTCLPSIIVTSMSCLNGTTGITYGHTVRYTNTSQPSHLANRSLTYTLNPDGSSTEIAYQFAGYLVADRITITYCTTGGTTTVIDDWVIGTDCTGTTYTSLPKLYDAQSLNTTITLTGFTYQSGDYLLFDVYPSYNNPGYTDTNWQLAIKCFDTNHRLSSYWPPISIQEVDTGATMTFTYDSANCRYLLTFDSVVTGLTASSVLYSDMYLYTLAMMYWSNNWESTGNTASLVAYSGLSIQYVNYDNDGGYNNYYPLFGQLNIFISGTSTTHIVRYTFTDQTDYYDYKNSYTAMTQSANWTDYVADGHDLRHYKYQQRNFKISMTSGDTWTNDYMYFNYDAVFNFDDVGKIIDITTVPMIVTYTGITCDRTGTDLLSYASGVNRIYSAWTQNYDTIWGTRNAFDFYYSTIIDKTESVNYAFSYVTLPLQTVGTGLNFNQPGWADPYFYKDYLRVTITDMTDPLNNYQVHTRLNPVTGLVGSWRLLRSVP